MVVNQDLEVTSAPKFPREAAGVPILPIPQLGDHRFLRLLSEQVQTIQAQYASFSEAFIQDQRSRSADPSESSPLVNVDSLLNLNHGFRIYQYAAGKRAG